ncbi:phosphatase PAP2 family protein [Calothrix sp. UHCC 0171]|uniref:phosphatase PAP2 family protein n=1 Tax=Calothrix sp. UHCC 0171 TaxID=3110245 RepID=UPI002B2018A6|nr:phosphatase PAP2 family protein [Calothrix sp. UHCC 0171]MEA5570336.1 phosphatase PAP2 family protein [Calothrix sp. UHCC 0171]
MISQNYQHLNLENSLVQAIHTSVKGRARFKVKWLDGNKSIKKNLELKLSKSEFISQAIANDLTGNILVFFHPNESWQLIANLIKTCLLDYIKQINRTFISSNSLSTNSENCKFQSLSNHVFDVSNIFSFVNEVRSSKEIVSVPVNLDLQKSLNYIFINNENNNNYYSEKFPSKKTIKSQKINLINPINHIFLHPFILVRKQINKLLTNINFASTVPLTLLSVSALIHLYGLDKIILLAVQKTHTPLLNHIMTAITSLCEPLVLVVVCSGFSLMTPSDNRRPLVTNLMIAAVAAIGMNYLLKGVFARARPALWKHIVDVGYYSFPSGHAMVSLVIYGFLGFVLANQYPQYKKQILTLTALLILAIGFSRLYLGVHWATDVLVGYAVGLLWLMACLRGLELRGNYTA